MRVTARKTQQPPEKVRELSTSSSERQGAGERRFHGKLGGMTTGQSRENGFSGYPLLNTTLSQGYAVAREDHR